MLTVSELRSFLQAHDVRLTKRLGQHPPLGASLARRLIELIHLSPNETVVEIGAGLGALTELLSVQAGCVIVVELDWKICELLRVRLAACSNVSVLCEDILTFSWAAHQRSVVVGAIPYHITSPIIASLCDNRRAIREAWLILQSEVADRLTAAPGPKAYGRLSILGQYSWDIETVMSIPRSAFFPQQEVD